MKTTLLRNMLMALIVIAGISLTSCKDKKTETEETTETQTLETTEGSDDPVMDTIVTKDDTIIKTGGGEKDNPAGEQVP
jgi:hypothetical protein